MKARVSVVALVTAVAVLGTAPVGVQAPGTGSITGRVTEWGTGDPIERVTVEVSSVDIDETDHDGYYTISDLAPGGHVLWFDHPNPDYADMYYPYSTTLAGAECVEVTADATTHADGAMQLSRTLIGRISDDQTGEPVAGICAEAFTYGGATGKTDISDSGGWVTINFGSEDNQTFVRITDCAALGYADEWYADLPDFGVVHGTPVYDDVLSGIGRFDAYIGEPGSISGTVKDEGGNPVAGICVDASYFVAGPGTPQVATLILEDDSRSPALRHTTATT